MLFLINCCRFREGLNDNNLVDTIKRKPELWGDVFHYKSPVIPSAIEVEDMFGPPMHRSEVGSNRYNAEKRNLTYFRDLLQDLEYGMTLCKLQ